MRVALGVVALLGLIIALLSGNVRRASLAEKDTSTPEAELA